MSKQILTFELKKEKRQAVQQTGKKLGIRIIEVGPEQYGTTLGELCGMAAPVRKGNNAIGKFKPFPKEMLIFSGLSSEDLDLFLAEYKKTGAEKIDLKAALTPTNAKWTPVMLFMEIMKEHVTMMAR